MLLLDTYIQTSQDEFKHCSTCVFTWLSNRIHLKCLSYPNKTLPPPIFVNMNSTLLVTKTYFSFYLMLQTRPKAYFFNFPWNIWNVTTFHQTLCAHLSTSHHWISCDCCYCPLSSLASTYTPQVIYSQNRNQSIVFKVYQVTSGHCWEDLQLPILSIIIKA